MNKVCSVAVLGLNGSGKSTLAHALAKRTGRYEIDAEDCYFPEQKESRLAALEDRYEIPCRHLGELPFSVPRTREEAHRILLEETEAHPAFVFSGVTANFPEAVAARIGLAVILAVPTGERVRRVQQREKERFGSRVLPGGDMYAQQAEFRRQIAEREVAAVRKSAARLGCPVLELDGTKRVSENMETVMRYLERWD